MARKTKRAAKPKAKKAARRPAPKRPARPAAVPKGYRTVQPYLIVEGAAKALAYYKAAFGAKERLRFPAPGGRIGHAEIQIGDCVVMLADQAPDHGAFAPAKYGGSPVSLTIYVPDVDAVVKRAVAAGGTLTRAVADQFYGDRSGGIEDPFGHHWHISTHIEDVSPKEMDRRLKAMMKGGG
jgi:PhnB protein